MGRGARVIGALRRSVHALLAIATVASAHHAMNTDARIFDTERPLPSLTQLRLASLGFPSLVADFYWLEAMQLVGSQESSSKLPRGRVASLIELVSGLDPWVDHPYRFAAIWLTDTLESVRRANRLLERGIAYHPRDWRNRHYLGFNHFFYLGDQRSAADVLSAAIGLEGAPHYLAPLVAKLQVDSGGLEAAEALLVGLVSATSDDYAKARYLKSLDEIETERHARRLEEARLEYQKRFGRDITRVADLVAVLPGLPPAHPHFKRFTWFLDEETGLITSGFYGSRYRLYSFERDAERITRWRREVRKRGGRLE